MKPVAAIWTLGHSRHAIADFIALASTHDIALIADVRGQPFSRYNPQFNRERFRASLAEAGIDYVWYGEALSGRPKDQAVLAPDGTIDWDLVRSKPTFQKQVRDLFLRAADIPTAIVCAEEDPKRCHRRFLVAPALMELGAEILHIRGDGRIEPEADLSMQDAERRQPDLFNG